MSDLYSSGQIRTSYVDPVSFVPNGRCAFELDADKVAYLSNMRLLNLGCVTDATPGEYSRGLGSLACIKNIRLMDARTELGALRNPAQYLFWKNVNRTNSENKSNDSYLKRNGIGQEIQVTSNKVHRVYASNVVTNDPDTTNLGYLDLREVFPILNEVAVLPVAVFSNLRIEIEFEANVNRQILTDTARPVTIQRPVLALDHTDDPETVKQALAAIAQGVSWREIENDNFTMAAVAIGANPNVRQAVQFQSMAFRGKYLERMLLCKQLQTLADEQTGTTVLGYGGVASSQAVLEQHTQYRLNGKNILPGFNGTTRPNEALGLLSDEWGVSSMLPGGNLYQWSNIGLLNAGGSDNSGQTAWDAIRVGARVSELQVQLSRLNNQDTSTTKTPTNSALTINLYAEVQKQLTVMGNDYIVGYM